MLLPILVNTGILMVVISLLQDEDECLGIGVPLCATAKELRRYNRLYYYRQGASRFGLTLTLTLDPPQDGDDCLGIGTPLCATAERLRASAL